MRLGRTKASHLTALASGLSLLLVAGACDSLGPVVCTDQFVYGIVLSAVDAVSKSPVSEGLQGITIQGSVSAPMEGSGGTLVGAGETSGNFTVVVTAPGYKLWTRTNVEVTGDQCHVRTVHLTAELEPLEP